MNCQSREADYNDDQAEAPDRKVPSELRAAFGGRPVPSPQQTDIDVQKRCGKADEIDQRAGSDDPGRQVAKLLGEGQSLSEALPAAATAVAGIGAERLVPERYEVV